jgi:hypothetical protein
MGCTGPVILVAKEDTARAQDLLANGKFIEKK